MVMARSRYELSMVTINGAVEELLIRRKGRFLLHTSNGVGTILG